MSTAASDAPSSPERIALLVLGMHRSGTSALTRTLNLLGADLPRNLHPPKADNPTGYWESTDWIELHDELLAAHGLSWDSPLPLPAAALTPEALAPFHARLVDLLRRDFSNSALFVAKDPRICRLLPLWHAALAEAGFAARHVIIVRHPLEVAASLAVRNETPQDTALLLWMRHILEAEQASRGKPRVFVSYDALLEDWRPVIDQIAAAFKINWPVSPAAAQVEIEKFLKRDLRHHARDNNCELARYTWLSDLYTAARASIADERSAIGAFDETRRALMASDQLHIYQTQLLGEIQRLTDFNQSLNNELVRHRETVARVQTEAATLWGHIKYRDTEIGQLKTEIEGLSSIVATAEKRYAYQESEIARVRAELAARESEVARLGEDVAKLRNQLERVTTSWFWRATKPLRLILARKPR